MALKMNLFIEELKTRQCESQNGQLIRCLTNASMVLPNSI